MSQPVKEELSAEELLGRVAQRDIEALGDLYDRFAPRLLGMLTRILPDRGQAEEVLQEVFRRLWDDAKPIAAAQGSIGAWFMVTARQSAIDRLRAGRIAPARAAQKHRANGPAPKPPSKSVARKSSAVPAGPASSMNSALLAALTPVWVPRRREIELTDERLGLLQKVMAQLPKSQRQALELAVFKGYTEAEIAQMLKEPLGKAKSGVRAAVTFFTHRRQAVLGTWAANI